MSHYLNKIKHIFKYFMLFCFVFIARNSYSQWQNINSGTQEDLVDGCFISDSVGFIISSEGTILKTVDAGDNWSINANLSGEFTSILKVNQDTIYAAGTLLYRSNDGGNSWNFIRSFNDTITDLVFFDSKVGLMIVPDLDSCYRGYYSITPNYRIYKTEDYGASWQYQFNEATQTSRFALINDSSVIVPRTEFTQFHGCGGPVFNNSLRTDDRGANWYRIFGESGGLYSFINNNVGYAFSSYYIRNLFFSRDGGKSGINFATFYNGGTSKQIDFINEIDGYLMGTHKLYSSRSKGINWTDEYTSAYELRHLFKNQQGTLICVGDSGTILKKTHIPSTQAESVYRLDHNRTALNFYNVNTANTSTQSVRFTNSGTQPLHLTFNASEDFKLSFSDSNFVDSTSITLHSFRDTVLNVQFNPLQDLVYTDTLIISGDSLVDILIPLAGKGFSGLSGSIIHDTLICVDTLNIAGDIIIPDSVTLEVCAGTYISIRGAYGIEVNGILRLLGDSLRNIKLRTFNSSIKWKGIKLNSANTQDTSIFRYCSFSLGSSSPFIAASSGSVTIDHSYFRNLSSNYPDGASAIETKGSAKMMLSNSTIRFNRGDAILCDFPDSTYILNNIIHNTRNGAGIKINSLTDAFIIGNQLYDNELEAILGNAPVTIRKNEIHNNGGGIKIDAPDMKITIEENVIYNNRSPKLGGVYIPNSAELLFRQNLIFNNEARSFDGGGLLLSFNDTAAKYIINNTICNNKVRRSSRGNNVFFHTSNDSTINLNVYNNIIYSSNEFDKSVQWYYIEGQNISYNCINQPGIELLGATNINADPAFVNPTTMANIGSYDWSLDSSSICIDAGHPSDTSFLLLSDIAGNPRIIDGRVDIGAYEFIGPTSLNEIRSNSFKIYPNPVEDKLYISSNHTAQCEIIMYDATSKVVLRETFLKRILLNVSSLKSGIYFYTIQSEKKLIGQGKVVKY